MSSDVSAGRLGSDRSGRLRFAIGVPNVAEFADVGFLVELAQCVEEAGWDGFFVWDHLQYREPDRRAVDGWTIITAAAAVTTRVRLGVIATAVPRRQPALLAHQAATVDQLSLGRLVVGVGLGSIDEEYRGFGYDPDPRLRGRRLDEALSVMTGLWGDKPVHHEGEFFRVHAPALAPRPVQRPRPPIWVAGRWPNRKPFRRASLYEGVVPTHAGYGHAAFMSPAELAEIVDFVDAARSHGRPRPEIVLEAMSESRAELEELSQRYAASGLTWWIEKLGWWRGDLGRAMARAADGPAT